MTALGGYRQAVQRAGRQSGCTTDEISSHGFYAKKREDKTATKHDAHRADVAHRYRCHPTTVPQMGECRADPNTGRDFAVKTNLTVDKKCHMESPTKCLQDTCSFGTTDVVLRLDMKGRMCNSCQREFNAERNSHWHKKRLHRSFRLLKTKGSAQQGSALRPAGFGAFTATKHRALRPCRQCWGPREHCLLHWEGALRGPAQHSGCLPGSSSAELGYGLQGASRPSVSCPLPTQCLILKQ